MPSPHPARGECAKLGHTRSLQCSTGRRADIEAIIIEIPPRTAQRLARCDRNSGRIAEGIIDVLLDSIRQITVQMQQGIYEVA